jgi:hypothetical protein
MTNTHHLKEVLKVAMGGAQDPAHMPTQKAREHHQASMFLAMALLKESVALGQALLEPVAEVS